MNKQLFFPALTAVFAILLPVNLMARTKLVTLPDRDRMVVNLENPQYSLLYEEREIALQEGINEIDFSWQGVSIDKNSIQLTVLDHPGEGEEATKIISVAFPPNEAALTWTLYSPEARIERVRVSYLLNGISRETSYEMTVNADETEAKFRQYFRMSNGSGEDLDEAVIRINQADDWTRSIEAGETRRFLSYQNPSMPIEKVYEARPAFFSSRGDDGEVISMIYEIENSEASGLGDFMLSHGKARIFGEVAGQDSTIFLGEDYMEQVPPGDEAELTLGNVKDVVLKRRIMADRQENVRRNSKRRIVLYDRVLQVRYELENFKDEEATIRVVETLSPDAQLVEISNDNVTTERKSGNELIVTINLPPKRADAEEVPVHEVSFTYEIQNVIN